MNFVQFTMAIHFYHLYIKQKITINIMYLLNIVFDTLLKNGNLQYIIQTFSII